MGNLWFAKLTKRLQANEKYFIDSGLENSHKGRSNSHICGSYVFKLPYFPVYKLRLSCTKKV